jgi:hypothetical protein
MVIDVSGAGVTAQELTVALFSRGSPFIRATA